MSERKAAGKDVEVFRQIHDKAYRVPKVVKAALDELGESWEYEAEFLKRSGISVADLAVFRDQFSQHWFEAKTANRNTKRVWCGTVKLANKLREFNS